MNTAPHFLRFTRALALGATVIAAGCGANVQPDTGPDASSNDVASADSTTVNVDECSTCECSGIAPLDVATQDAGSRPMCTGALLRCCAAIGPLPPPELLS
jgi:hypothetical protein